MSFVERGAHAAVVGGVLRELREEAGFRQFDVARHFGRSQSWVSRYESGVIVFEVFEFVRLCRALGIPVAEAADRIEAALDRL